MIDKEQGLHSFGWVADISKVWLCLSLCDWHLGISFLTSLYPQLFKYIAYLGPFVQFWGGGRPSVYTEKNPKLSSSDRVEILPGVWLEPDWGLLMARHVKVETPRLPPIQEQSQLPTVIHEFQGNHCCLIVTFSGQLPIHWPKCCWSLNDSWIERESLNLLDVEASQKTKKIW